MSAGQLGVSIPHWLPFRNMLSQGDAVSNGHDWWAAKIAFVYSDWTMVGPCVLTSCLGTYLISVLSIYCTTLHHCYAVQS